MIPVYLAAKALPGGRPSPPRRWRGENDAVAKFHGRKIGRHNFSPAFVADAVRTRPGTSDRRDNRHGHGLLGGLSRQSVNRSEGTADRVRAVDRNRRRRPLRSCCAPGRAVSDHCPEERLPDGGPHGDRADRCGAGCDEFCASFGRSQATAHRQRPIASCQSVHANECRDGGGTGNQGSSPERAKL